MLHNLVLGEIADCNNKVSIMQPLPFYIIYMLVRIAPCPVEFSGVHMHNQWLSCFLLHIHASLVCHPVMCMYDVKRFILGNHPCLFSIPFNLLVKVMPIYRMCSIAFSL